MPTVEYPKNKPQPMAHEVFHPEEMGWVRLTGAGMPEKAWELPDGRRHVFPKNAPEVIVVLKPVK
jgi:hypothetical protein